jgi:hypothetical protein
LTVESGCAAAFSHFHPGSQWQQIFYIIFSHIPFVPPLLDETALLLDGANFSIHSPKRERFINLSASSAILIIKTIYYTFTPGSCKSWNRA